MLLVDIQVYYHWLQKFIQESYIKTHCSILYMLVHQKKYAPVLHNFCTTIKLGALATGVIILFDFAGKSLMD